ncbi:MAG: hypothetical protein ACREQJ_07575 [Candidatus Binatia bacterium]
MNKRWIVVVGLAVTLAAAPVRAEEESYSSDFGMGMASVGVNLLYMPAKFVYATLGGITGGFAYILTGANFEVADRVWAPSLGGNYVVTPAHLRNEETLYFSGSTERAATAPEAAPSAPAAGGDEWGASR